MRIIRISGLLPLLLHAEYNPARWPYRRAFEVEITDRVHRIKLDGITLRRAQDDLADVRIDFQNTEVPYVAERRAGADWIPVATLETKAGSAHQFDLGDDPPPFERLRVDVSDRAFQRRVELRTSGRGESWQYLAGATLSRLNGTESLTLDTGWRRTRYLRLVVFNQDNPPLRIERLFLERAAWDLKFLPGTSGRYLLVYGNERARRPQYDLPAVLAARPTANEIEIVPQSEMRNPDYAPQLPWTERHSMLLYGTLIAAVLALGVVAVRFFLKVRGEPSNP